MAPRLQDRARPRTRQGWLPHSRAALADLLGREGNPILINEIPALVFSYGAIADESHAPSVCQPLPAGAYRDSAAETLHA